MNLDSLDFDMLEISFGLFGRIRRFSFLVVEYPKVKVVSSIQNVSLFDMIGVGVGGCVTGTLVIHLDGLFSVYTTSVSDAESES